MFDQPYLGNVTVFAGNFAPVGWMFCNGQLLAISENDALFALIGTTYGGDGVTTFALPNFQSRVAVHQGTLSGSPYIIGMVGGTENITLTINQMPAHNHPFVSASGNIPASSSNSGNVATPQNNVPAVAPVNLYNPSGDGLGMGPGVANGSTGIAGGSLPVSILSPYLAMNYIIAVFGIFPVQS
ncbi:MAG: phage tail protein [Chitinophagaceae bacterium]|nr:phage tail protein [Chitinophagaceae bacterium]